MLAILTHWGVDDIDDREEFIEYWQSMDDTWIGYQNERAEQRDAAARARSGG